MIRAVLFAVVVAALAIGSAAAAERGRFVLEPAEDGFIRLDTETGTVSHCRSRDGNWRCESLADERKALDDEIGRLAEENRRLEQRVAELEAELGHDHAPGGSSLKLPSEEDVDRVVGFFENLMRRLIDMARGLNEDPGQKT